MKEMRYKGKCMSHSETSENIDLLLPAITDEQLKPLIDVLTDLLFRERVRELGLLKEGDNK